MENHPVTELFPLMTGKDYEKLVGDICENGLREPIWLHPDGRIIDGRNRWRACEDAKVEPQTRVWDGEGSLTAFVVSLNLHRRHLTSSQRAAAAAEALPMLKAEAKERMRKGGRRKGRQKIAYPSVASPTGKDPLVVASFPDAGKATERAAKMFGTNRTYVRVAARLKDKDPDVFAAVRSGEITVFQQMDITQHIQRDPEINRRVASLGLGATDLVKLAKLGKKGPYIVPALDILESDAATTVEEAVAQVRQNIPHLPSPSKAREIAREIGFGTEASDGNIYFGATEEEEAELTRLRTRTYTVIDATNFIAGLDASPKQWISEAKEWQLQDLSLQSVETCVSWLSALAKELRAGQADAEAAETAGQPHSPAS